MDSSLRKTRSIFSALRAPSRTTRKAAKPSRVACEALEGRQLLTGGAPIAGTMMATQMSGPVEIRPGSGPAVAITGKANDVLLRPDAVNLPALTVGQAATEVRPMIAYDAAGDASGAATSGVAHAGLLATGSPDVMLTSTLATTIHSVPSVPASDALGDRASFFSTRGGVAMGDAQAQAMPMPMPSANSALGDGELAKAQRKLDADQATVNAKSRVTPEMVAAVQADLEAIDAARKVDPDPALVATLRVSEEALQIAEVPTDELLARFRADSSAVYLSEGVPQGLIDKLHADQATMNAASNVTAADLKLLAADRAALQALSDAAIQTFRGSATSNVTTLAATTADVTTLADIPALDEPMIPLQAAPADGIPVDESQMATTSLTPTDVKVIMAPATSRSTIKFKGEAQVKKQVKGLIVKARANKAFRLRLQQAGRRAGFMRMT